MSIIEKIVGVLPTVRERARTILDFALSTKGKVILALAVAVIAIGYAHHRGVESQEPAIAALRKELGETKLKLAAAQQPKEQVPFYECNGPKETRHPRCPDESQPVPPKVKSWLEEQARINEQLDLKVKKYEKDLAKRPARGGDRLTAAESRRLLDIR
ncbi:hypothetical protein [Bradyrhizobium sp. USDA 241]|uniref:hypothetical protein n=1 Tax=Bradyrhizobium sp. USDA 241 TaxID=3377725 RepID=UPI003C7211B2